MKELLTLLTGLILLVPKVSSQDVESLKSKLSFAKNDVEVAQIEYLIADKLSLENLTEAIRHQNKAYQLRDKCSDSLYCQISLLSVSLHSEQGYYSKALEVAFSSIERFKKSNPKYLIELYNRIGRCYSYHNNRAEGMKYLHQALDMAKEIDSSNLPMYLANIGANYTRLGDYSSGKHYLHLSLNILPENEEYTADALIFNNASYGFALCQLGEMDSAYHYFNLAQSHLKETPSVEYPLLMKEFWSTYYFKKTNFSKSIAYADSLLHESRILDQPLFELAALNLLKNAYLIGQPEYSVKYSDSIIALKDRISIRDLKKMETIMSNNITLIENESAFSQKELKTALKLKNASLERNRLYLLIFILVTIGAISTIMILIIFRKTKLRKKQLELKQEKMKLELSGKNSELSNNVLRIAHLNKFMEGIQTELEENNVKLDSDQKMNINRLIRRIKSNTNKDIWEEFEIRFKQAHTEFFETLIKEFPTLSFNERRLCSFLKLNMSSKEISSITGQTPHSINIARTRLRKKLGIVNNPIGLVEFIGKINKPL